MMFTECEKCTLPDIEMLRSRMHELRNTHIQTHPHTYRGEHSDSNELRRFDEPQIALFTFSIEKWVINSNYIITLMLSVVWTVEKTFSAT